MFGRWRHLKPQLVAEWMQSGYRVDARWFHLFSFWFVSISFIQNKWWYGFDAPVHVKDCSWAFASLEWARIHPDWTDWPSCWIATKRHSRNWTGTATADSSAAVAVAVVAEKLGWGIPDNPVTVLWSWAIHTSHWNIVAGQFDSFGCWLSDRDLLSIQGCRLIPIPASIPAVISISAWILTVSLKRLQLPTTSSLVN